MQKEIISINLYYTDYVTKKDRRIEYPKDFNPQILSNSIKLLIAVNALLNDLGIQNGDVTSGWRPASINGQTQNAAKRSYHMVGLAIDLLDDKDQTLAKLIASKPDLLKKYNLWMEDIGATRGKNTNWTHLDLGIRSDRPSRVFLP